MLEGEPAKRVDELARCGVSPCVRASARALRVGEPRFRAVESSEVDARRAPCPRAFRRCRATLCERSEPAIYRAGSRDRRRLSRFCALSTPSTPRRPQCELSAPCASRARFCPAANGALAVGRSDGVSGAVRGAGGVRIARTEGWELLAARLRRFGGWESSAARRRPASDLHRIATGPSLTRGSGRSALSRARRLAALDMTDLRSRHHRQGASRSHAESADSCSMARDTALPCESR